MTTTTVALRDGQRFSVRAVCLGVIVLSFVTVWYSAFVFHDKLEVLSPKGSAHMIVEYLDRNELIWCDHGREWVSLNDGCPPDCPQCSCSSARGDGPCRYLLEVLLSLLEQKHRSFRKRPRVPRVRLPRKRGGGGGGRRPPPFNFHLPGSYAYVPPPKPRYHETSVNFEPPPVPKQESPLAGDAAFFAPPAQRPESSAGLELSPGDLRDAPAELKITLDDPRLTVEVPPPPVAELDASGAPRAAYVVEADAPGPGAEILPPGLVATLSAVHTDASMPIRPDSGALGASDSISAPPTIANEAGLFDGISTSLPDTQLLNPDALSGPDAAGGGFNALPAAY